MKPIRTIGHLTGWLLCLLLAAAGTLRAQTDKYYVDVELSNASPLMTEQVTLSYKLKYRGNSISLMNPRFELEAPGFGGFFDIVQEGRRGGMDLDFSGSITVFEYVYVLKPLKTGPVTISPIGILFNGNTYRSKSVSVKVLAADTPPDIAQADNIFIDASISKTNPYKGEEFLLSYKLYSRYELLGIEDQQAPTIEGFSSNILNRDQQARIKVEKINGQDYYTLDLYRSELYPLRDGEFRIDPFEMTVVASVPTGRRIRDFWGNRLEVKRESVKLKSPAVRVYVRDLPAAGRPEDFNGAVGQFDLKTTLSATETVTGEPLTLKIQLSGEGNLKLVGDPKLDLPPGFESYDPKITLGNGSKTYEYLLIPGKPGDFTLNPMSFSYFDPKQERYISLGRESFSIRVGQGSGAVLSTGGTAGMTKEEVEKLGRDIRYLVTETPAFSAAQPPLLGSALFYVGLAGPLVLAFPLFFFARSRRERLADVRGRRHRQARKAAEKRLKHARSLAGSGERKLFYDELVRALWGYLSDKFGMTNTDLNREEIRLRLEGAGLPETEISALLDLLDRAEMALYAPVQAGDLNRDCDAALQLLTGMDAQLIRKTA